MIENRCRCGMPTACGQSWCRRCIDVRDREMGHCMLRIRQGTGLDLTSAETEQLMLEYLERRTNGKA